MTPDPHDSLPPANCRCRRDFLRHWLGEDSPEALESLWHAADETRRQFVGDEITVWGAIKISNHCDDDCGFCGLRSGKLTLPRYRLSADEVLAAARAAKEAGARQVVLQSGRDPGLAAEWVSGLICRLREETGLDVALSLGERSEAEVAAWRRAGAVSYLLRFMTANTTLYRFLHAQACDDPRRRLPLLATLKQLGYRVGSGLLVGFPGQSPAGLAEDLEFVRKLDLDIILIGPYVWPAELTAAHMPGQDGDPNSAPAVLKVLALARQLCPGADIPSTAALATVGGLSVHGAALRRGANVLMVDATPAREREANRCYPGRVAVDVASYQEDVGGLKTLVKQSLRGAATSQQAATAMNGAALPPEQGVRVGVCMGSSCFSRGNNHTVTAIRDFIAGRYLEERAVLEGHLCEGRCKDGPNVTVGDDLLQRADPATVIGDLRQRLNLKE